MCFAMPRLVLLLLLVVALGGAVSAAQQKDARSPAPGIGDPAKLEGKMLHKARFDDVRVLGILGFSLINEAQAKGEKIPLAQLALSGLAVKAFNAKDNETAFRYATRFILQRRGVPLSEETEVASSLDFQLGVKIVTPGEPVPIRLDPVFTLSQPLAGPYTAKFSLHSAAGERISEAEPIVFKHLEGNHSRLHTENLKEGRYVLSYELFSPSKASLIRCERDFFVHKGVKSQVKVLRDTLATLQGRKAAWSARQTAALESIRYLTDLLERARKEYVAPMTSVSHPMVIKLRGQERTRVFGDSFHIDNDLRLARALAEGLQRGEDPLATQTGDLHLAYLSGVDKTLQPFRVFIPTGYDATKKYPLVVALHGATGDENTYMERYPVPGKEESLFKRLGQERGYILVSPNGRGAFGGYTGDSERDVLDVLDRVQQVYAIDPRQVYLTGHSMGAIGTWLIGFRHPERFAALAPLAGRPQDIKSIGLTKAPQLPVLMHHGAKDTVATVQAARELVKVAEKELKQFKYVETQDDHFVIGVTSMPAIFDFFDAQRVLRNTVK